MIDLIDYCQSRGLESEGSHFDTCPPSSRFGIRYQDSLRCPNQSLEKYGFITGNMIGSRTSVLGGTMSPSSRACAWRLVDPLFCGPFTGWYISTEIGARNFADEERYARYQGCQEARASYAKNRNLWKDEALLVLNRAVSYPFDDGVQIIDYYTVTDQINGSKKRGRSRARRDR